MTIALATIGLLLFIPAAWYINYRLFMTCSQTPLPNSRHGRGEEDIIQFHNPGEDGYIQLYEEEGYSGYRTRLPSARRGRWEAELSQFNNADEREWLKRIFWLNALK